MVKGSKFYTDAEFFSADKGKLRVIVGRKLKGLYTYREVRRSGD